MADQPGYVLTPLASDPFVSILKVPAGAVSFQVVQTANILRAKRTFPVIPTEKTVVQG
jgi:hypothetical protein